MIIQTPYPKQDFLVCGLFGGSVGNMVSSTTITSKSFKVTIVQSPVVLVYEQEKHNETLYSILPVYLLHMDGSFVG
jgi:hypothetical protein